jgi:hypothetical protein
LKPIKQFCFSGPWKHVWVQIQKRWWGEDKHQMCMRRSQHNISWKHKFFHHLSFVFDVLFCLQLINHVLFQKNKFRSLWVILRSNVVNDSNFLILYKIYNSMVELCSKCKFVVMCSNYRSFNIIPWIVLKL